jgi:murein DD-endopeptidase MepM/ murein hydrolase activator NlpD
MRTSRTGGRMGAGAAGLLALACGGEPEAVHGDDPRGTPPALTPAQRDTDGAAPALHAGPPLLPALTWPVRPVHVTSDFGWRTDPVTGKGTRLHKGIDVRGAIGDLVLSVADGTVRFAGHDPLLGNMIVIDHGDGLESWYGHMSDLLVHDGLPVERGAAIGLVGNSGRSAAPHLHLTMKLDGEPIDPRRLLGQPKWRPEGWLPAPETTDD